MNTWFSSDTHLGHSRIIGYCQRPFKSLEEMDLTIIRRWNERVKKDDLVYFLGDFCFRKCLKEAPDSKTNAFDYYRQQLNGNIIFIQGNHDQNNSVKSKIQNIVIKYAGKFIKLTHNPCHAEGKYDINLVGHVHNQWAVQQRTMDCHITTLVNVGVDVWKFRPVCFNEIMQAINKYNKENKNEE